jgi:predicted lipid carrier protein YhbT
MVAGKLTAKLIVSPSAALASAARSVPAPLSAVLVTVIVAARRVTDVAQSNARHEAATATDVSLVFMFCFRSFQMVVVNPFSCRQPMAMSETSSFLMMVSFSRAKATLLNCVDGQLGGGR